MKGDARQGSGGGDPAPRRGGDPSRRGVLEAITLLGPAAGYVAAVFVMGSVPVRGSSVSVSDKVLHLVIFGLMVLPMLRATRFLLPAAEVRTRLFWAAGGATLAGGLLEVWQAALPHRSAEFLDWVADAAGAVLVSGFAWAVVSFSGRHRRGRGVG